jgi:hypothetical protein
MSFYAKIPRPLKYLYYLYVRYIRRDEVWAGLLRDWHEKSVYEYQGLIMKREAYKAKWHEWWEHEAEIDFLITVPNATPAVPHNGMKEAVSSCGYTFLFNLVITPPLLYRKKKGKKKPPTNLPIFLARLHGRRPPRNPCRPRP